MPIKVLSSKFLDPLVVQIEKTRCQADVQENSDYGTAWRTSMVKGKARRYALSERVMQCTFNAVVEIDGVPMCRRHAGQLVLARYIKGDLVEKDK